MLPSIQQLYKILSYKYLNEEVGYVVFIVFFTCLFTLLDSFTFCFWLDNWIVLSSSSLILVLPVTPCLWLLLCWKQGLHLQTKLLTGSLLFSWDMFFLAHCWTWPFLSPLPSSHRASTAHLAGCLQKLPTILEQTFQVSQVDGFLLRDEKRTLVPCLKCDIEYQCCSSCVLASGSKWSNSTLGQLCSYPWGHVSRPL